MFIKNVKGGYTRDGSQWASGYFLCLCHPSDSGIIPVSDYPAQTRAFVCYARMSQLGPWMMANVKIIGHELTLSGAYGQDGLIMDVPRALWEKATQLPNELYEAWKAGGGWNSAGSEAESMRQWAMKNFDLLHLQK